MGDCLIVEFAAFVDIDRGLVGQYLQVFDVAASAWRQVIDLFGELEINDIASAPNGDAVVVTYGRNEFGVFDVHFGAWLVNRTLDVDTLANAVAFICNLRWYHTIRNRCAALFS